MKTIKIFITLILLTFTTQLVLAQTNSTSQEITIKKSAVKVKGVTCKNDLKSIADNVEKLQGVSACKAEKAGPTTTFQVQFNPLLVSEKEIFAAIEATPGCENPKDRPYKVKK
ncbi:MAG: heavy-metal-associated domain-containing protein [Pedobacter sp.]|nr:MAG: heavy-metal-associated domain-containing protein [Pedobacter sp.]